MTDVKKTADVVANIPAAAVNAAAKELAALADTVTSSVQIVTASTDSTVQQELANVGAHVTQMTSIITDLLHLSTAK